MKIISLFSIHNIYDISHKMSNESKSSWTFFTNHTHVIICLAREPGLSLREVALKIGVTERAVHRIIADLEQEGYLSKKKVGRQNEYTLDLTKPLRHEMESNYSIGEALQIFFGK